MAAVQDIAVFLQMKDVHMIGNGKLRYATVNCRLAHGVDRRMGSAIKGKTGVGVVVREIHDSDSPFCAAEGRPAHDEGHACAEAIHPCGAFAMYVFVMHVFVMHVFVLYVFMMHKIVISVFIAVVFRSHNSIAWISGGLRENPKKQLLEVRF